MPLQLTKALTEPHDRMMDQAEQLWNLLAASRRLTTDSFKLRMVGDGPVNAECQIETEHDAETCGHYIKIQLDEVPMSKN